MKLALFAALAMLGAAPAAFAAPPPDPKDAIIAEQRQQLERLSIVVQELHAQRDAADSRLQDLVGSLDGALQALHAQRDAANSQYQDLVANQAVTAALKQRAAPPAAPAAPAPAAKPRKAP